MICVDSSLKATSALLRRPIVFWSRIGSVVLIIAAEVIVNLCLDLIHPLLNMLLNLIKEVHVGKVGERHYGGMRVEMDDMVNSICLTT